MESLEKELLHGLEVIPENDRDLHSLVIWCNPNFIRGAEKDLQPKILKILNRFKKEGKITTKKKLIKVSPTHSKKQFLLYSLK